MNSEPTQDLATAREMLTQASEQLRTATLVLATRGRQETEGVIARIEQSLRQSQLEQQAAHAAHTQAIKDLVAEQVSHIEAALKRQSDANVAARIERDALFLDRLTAICRDAVAHGWTAAAKSEPPSEVAAPPATGPRDEGCPSHSVDAAKQVTVDAARTRKRPSLKIVLGAVGVVILAAFLFPHMANQAAQWLRNAMTWLSNFGA